MKIGLIGGQTISKYTVAPALWHTLISEPVEYKMFAFNSARNIFKTLKDPSFSGFNVAKPYKETACALGISDDEITRKLGICNTVYLKGGKLHCTNTDGYGCLDAMELSGFKPKGSETLVLGCGGAGASLVFALIKQGSKVWIFDTDDVRTTWLITKLEISKNKVFLWDKHKLNFDAIINATPAGIKINGTKNHLKTPLSVSFLNQLTARFFVEMNYNPFKTVFLKTGERQGAIVVPGVYMLYFQAKRAAKQFDSSSSICSVDTMIKNLRPLLE